MRHKLVNIITIERSICHMISFLFSLSSRRQGKPPWCPFTRLFLLPMFVFAFSFFFLLLLLLWPRAAGDVVDVFLSLPCASLSSSLSRSHTVCFYFFFFSFVMRQIPVHQWRCSSSKLQVSLSPSANWKYLEAVLLVKHATVCSWSTKKRRKWPARAGGGGEGRREKKKEEERETK